MVVSILNIILALWSLIQMMFFSPNLQQINSELAQLNNPQIEQFVQKMLHLMYGPLGIVNVFFELAISALIFAGAKKMKSLAKLRIFPGCRQPVMVPCLTPCCGYRAGPGFWHLGAGGFEKAGSEVAFQLNADACSV